MVSSCEAMRKTDCSKIYLFSVLRKVNANGIGNIFYSLRKRTGKLTVLEWLASIPCNMLIVCIPKGRWWSPKSDEQPHCCSQTISLGSILLIPNKQWTWVEYGSLWYHLNTALLLEHSVQHCRLRSEPDKRNLIKERCGEQIFSRIS